MDDFEGEGSAVYLDLNSDSPDGLTAGTYMWSNDREAFTIVDGEAILNANIEMETGDLVTFIDGSVEIGVHGDETSFEFELTAEDGKKLTGNYKGALIRI